MESRLLMLGLFTVILIHKGLAEMCLSDPLEVSNATFKALDYKNGTMLNCECKKGFRRVNGLSYIICLQNSSWSGQCRCASNSNRNASKQVAAHHMGHRERQTTEMRSPAQPVDRVVLPGHCKEPPPWEHEGAQRIYHFMTGQVVQYQCVQGFKARQRAPATSICQSACGKTRWTLPLLTCVDEKRQPQFPDKEESQESTEALPNNEVSCPVIITDSPQITDASTTMETFILTVEHQVAVAGCIFLLISIFVLSWLTWQRRWKKSRRTI